MSPPRSTSTRSRPMRCGQLFQAIDGELFADAAEVEHHPFLRQEDAAGRALHALPADERERAGRSPPRVGRASCLRFQSQSKLSGSEVGSNAPSVTKWQCSHSSRSASAWGSISTQSTPGLGIDAAEEAVRQEAREARLERAQPVEGGADEASAARRIGRDEEELALRAEREEEDLVEIVAQVGQGRARPAARAGMIGWRSRRLISDVHPR